MALINSDRFVVQRQTGAKDHYSVALDQLYDYIAAHPTLNYRGLIDLTQPPTGQLDPEPSLIGDIYLNSTDGVLASGYTGVAAGTPVLADDRLIYNGTEYDIIHGGTIGVETVTGQSPIIVDNTDVANPVVTLPAIDGGEYAIVITGVVSGVSMTDLGSGLPDGIYTYETEAITGNGSGLTVEIRYSASAWTIGYLYIITGGEGYKVGDVVRVLGGSNDKEITVSSVTTSSR